MMRNLLLLALSVLAVLAASAQTTPQKNTTYTGLRNIDYTREGAPMPRFHALIYHDTSKRDTGALQGQQAATRSHRKAKKQKVAAQDAFIDGDRLKSRGNLFIMMFNPNCSHCEDMTVELKKKHRPV